MIKVLRDSQTLAKRKIREIVEQAVEMGADKVTIEFSKEGGLEVLFVFGNTGVGDILVEQNLEAAVMTRIHEEAGLEDKFCGVLDWKCQGQNLKINVEEYDSFGETGYKLTFPKRGLR